MPRAADMLGYRTGSQFGAGQSVDRSIPMATPSGEFIPTPPTASQQAWTGALSNPSVASILYGAGETAASVLSSPLPYVAGMVGYGYGALTGKDPRETGAQFQQATTLEPKTALGQYYTEQASDKLGALPPVISGIPTPRVGAGAARYAGQQYGMPMLEKSMTMYEQGKLTPGFTPISEIFIGEKAKGWNPELNAKAIEMEKAGATPREIWSQTMNWKGPEGLWRQEIDDSGASFAAKKIQDMPYKDTIKTHEALTHPKLYENYPGVQYYELGYEPTPGVAGSFNPKEQKFTVGGGSTLTNPEAIKSTLLHEIQHAIQSKEDFSRGGNPEALPTIVHELRKQDLSPLEEGASNWKFAANNLGRSSSNLYMHKLDKLSQSENIRPRQITGLADFYEYSNQIRSEYGPMPKRAGPERDSWMRNAANYIKEKNIEKKPYLANYENTDPKKQQSIYRSASRVMDKFAPDAFKYRETVAKYKTLAELTPIEQYMRSGGEAESRATQARMNLDMEQRRATFPEESYDRPTQDLILFNKQKLSGRFGNDVSQPTDIFSILYK